MTVEPVGNKVGFFSSCTTQSVAILGVITALLTALTAWLALTGQLSPPSDDDGPTQSRSQVIIEQPTETSRIEVPANRDDPHLRSGTYYVTTSMISNTCRPELIGEALPWKLTFRDANDNDGKIFHGDVIGIVIDDEFEDVYTLALPVTSIFVPGSDFDASLDIAIIDPVSIELAVYAIDAFGCEVFHQGSS